MSSKKDPLYNLYIELVKLQKHVIASGLKLLIVLEGRDAAGKDGTIKEITKHLSPRETRVVALAKPSDRQLQEWYFQRHVPHLPINGEMVIFNRSWYNRAGVEPAMGFCSEKEYKQFFTDVELFEQMLVNSGFIIVKYYLDISRKEQRKRLEERREDPLKQWKISPVDEAAQKNWDRYSELRDKMLNKTSFKCAPWFVVDAEDKKDMHEALITHLLCQVKYPDRKIEMTRAAKKLVKETDKDVVRGLYK